MVAKGIDMEALSPRDANAQRPQRVNDLKVKATAQLKANKDKEHPPPPPPHVTEPPAPDRKDGMVYQVGKLLGKGGFAVCYEGQPAGSRRKVALKVVKSQMPSKMEQKFQTELQIHSKMRQVNIVQFHRAFSFENSTYLVLELCPNGSLMDMVKRRKGVTEAEVRFYSVQIAGAIKYMHSKGIIHRDLKMGNIFLDKQMNAKIGDFGLAALVVTGRDMQTIRRTTLCGTPNYIAPEILEKGRKGHDHMVDIWSLGIIMFAMLTSKPPFQSTTTDEIYRRARDRDYEWPTRESSNKIISQEAKDLVATMLEDADNRPDPDTIVQHPFFLAGYMPLPEEITPKLREYPPNEERFYNFPRNDHEEVLNLLNLKDMCIACEVGPWNPTQVVHRPVWKEMAGEEQAGLTPAIPLAEGLVYRPFDEVAKEIRLQQRHAPQPSTAQAKAKADEKTAARNALAGLEAAPKQSFAAQQRAQARPTKAATGTVRLPEAKDELAKHTLPVRTKVTKEAEVVVSAREVLTVSEPASTIPQSAAGQSVKALEQTATLKSSTRSTRRQLPASRTEPVLSRVVSDGVKPETNRPRSFTPVMRREEPKETLFSPSECQEEVPSTRPDLVLERLQKLQTELERALNSRSMAFVSTREKTPSPPQIVVKWVDYTNKFGLGYILSDGSIGCILKQLPASEAAKAPLLPSACILIHDGERHIQRKNDPTYADRQQIVPMGKGIYFYENCGEAGLSRVRIDPRTFKVSVGSDGVAAKLTAGKDVFEHRKRERIVLWKKFANYMLAYGRELDDLGEEAPLPVPNITDPASAPTDLVTFYQRFGDVGCWAFSDGHMQFNFPDHTKVVLDSTGTWCHFWHLPEAAANRLTADGTLDESSLDARAVLSYPLQTLLNFSVSSKAAARAATSSKRRPEIPAELQHIPAANDFRRKVSFIKDVVKEWVAKGGIGNSDMSREGRIRWAGHRPTRPVQGAIKHIWVTIGARKGDERYMSMFDPRRPNEVGPDVEEPARKAASV